MNDLFIYSFFLSFHSLWMNCNRNSHIISSEWCIFTSSMKKSINANSLLIRSTDLLLGQQPAQSSQQIWDDVGDDDMRYVCILAHSCTSSFSFNSRNMCVYPVAVISYRKYFLFISLYRLVRTLRFSFSSLFINKTLKPNKQQLWNEFNSMKLLWMNGKLNNNFV